MKNSIDQYNKINTIYITSIPVVFSLICVTYDRLICSNPAPDRSLYVLTTMINTLGCIIFSHDFDKIRTFDQPISIKKLTFKTLATYCCTTGWISFISFVDKTKRYYYSNNGNIGFIYPKNNVIIPLISDIFKLSTLQYSWFLAGAIPMRLYANKAIQQMHPD